MLFTSQMNNEMLKGGKDRLAQFAPPMPHHVYMGGDKRKIATGMIGLHRRLRDRGECPSSALRCSSPKARVMSVSMPLTPWGLWAVASAS